MVTATAMGTTRLRRDQDDGRSGIDSNGRGRVDGHGHCSTNGDGHSYNSISRDRWRYKGGKVISLSASLHLSPRASLRLPLSLRLSLRACLSHYG
jgi:hypothetical protein